MTKPTPGPNGRALREVFRRWIGHETLDHSFARNVADVRQIASAAPDEIPRHD